jgi:hypothetical protein
MQTLALEICQSVAYHMATLSLEGKEDAPEAVPRTAGPGGYTMVWPLFLGGTVETTGKEQRFWMAEHLKNIGLITGNNQAIALSQAMMVAKDNDGFVESEMWTYTGTMKTTKHAYFWSGGMELGESNALLVARVLYIHLY